MSLASRRKVLGVKPIAIRALLIFSVAVGVTQQRPQEPHPAVTKWQALIPRIKNVLARQGHGYECPRQWAIGILDAADFPSADHVSVALVDWCAGGAYTDWVVAMQLENDQPVLSRFRGANGEVLDLGFGQGASVMHGLDVKLVPEKSAIYGMSWDTDECLHLTSCAVNAYVWNSKDKAFGFDSQLTTQNTESYCQELQKQFIREHGKDLPQYCSREHVPTK
jgi:hypothetical protein